MRENNFVYFTIYEEKVNIINVPKIAQIVRGITGVMLFQAISNRQKCEMSNVITKPEANTHHLGESMYLDIDFSLAPTTINAEAYGTEARVQGRLTPAYFREAPIAINNKIAM